MNKESDGISRREVIKTLGGATLGAALLPATLSAQTGAGPFFMGSPGWVRSRA